MPKTMVKRKTSGNRELASAWIGTVLNPIIRGLLQEKEPPVPSLTWRHTHKRFEDLFPVKDLVGPYYWPNCEQLLKSSVGFREHVARYDKALEELQKACSSAFDVLTKDPLYQELVKGHSHADERTLPYFAEYTLNMVQELPDDYAYKTVWNDNAQEFLKMRELPGRVGEVLRSVEKQRTMFTDVLEKFLAFCIRLRDDLADKFGLPRVPVANDALV